jgi:hypothetical protein
MAEGRPDAGSVLILVDMPSSEQSQEFGTFVSE